MKETEPFRYVIAYINCGGEMYSKSLLLKPESLLGKSNYYYRVHGNNLSKYLSYEEASVSIINLLDQAYVLPSWVKPEYEEDAQRFGYSSMFMMSKYHYVISLTHDLEKKTIKIVPYKYDGGTQEAFSDMETYVLQDTCTAEELSEALKKAYTFLESYSPIPEKYRTQPLNRDKVIAKWRKEHADDQRVAIDITKEKEVMETTRIK